MLKKYSILFGITILIVLLLVAALYYPEVLKGGKAINGSNNCIPVLDYIRDVVPLRQLYFFLF